MGKIFVSTVALKAGNKLTVDWETSAKIGFSQLFAEFASTRRVYDYF